MTDSPSRRPYFALVALATAGFVAGYALGYLRQERAQPATEDRWLIDEDNVALYVRHRLGHELDHAFSGATLVVRATVADTDARVGVSFDQTGQGWRVFRITPTSVFVGEWNKPDILVSAIPTAERSMESAALFPHYHPFDKGDTALFFLHPNEQLSRLDDIKVFDAVKFVPITRTHPTRQ